MYIPSEIGAYLPFIASMDSKVGYPSSGFVGKGRYRETTSSDNRAKQKRIQKRRAKKGYR